MAEPTFAQFKRRAAEQVGVPVSRWREYVATTNALHDLCRSQEWRLWYQNTERGYQFIVEAPGDKMTFRPFKSLIQAERKVYQSLQLQLKREVWLEKERKRLGVDVR